MRSNIIPFLYLAGYLEDDCERAVFDPWGDIFLPIY